MRSRACLRVRPCAVIKYSLILCPRVYALQMKVMRLDSSFQCFKAPTRKDLTPLDTLIPAFPGPVMELIHACLQPDATKRATAEQLMGFEFFRGVEEVLPASCRYKLGDTRTHTHTHTQRSYPHAHTDTHMHAWVYVAGTWIVAGRVTEWAMCVCVCVCVTQG